MIKQIRDDVITMEAYAAAAFKYDEEIELLYEIGGYCLLMQWKKKYGEKKAKAMAEDMQKHRLAETQYYSNAKYIYLSQNALKYLANRENIEETPKSKRKNIEKNPVEKIIIASIIKYEAERDIQIMKRTTYIKNHKEKIAEIQGKKLTDIAQLKEQKEKYQKEKETVIKLAILIEQQNKNGNKEIRKTIETILEKYRKTMETYEENIRKSEHINSIIETQARAGIILYDSSKIVTIPQDKEKLQVYIIDHNKIKSINKYMKQIEGFERAINNPFQSIEIIFITYKKDRYEKFQRAVQNYIEDQRPIKEIEVIEYEGCYWLEKIIERTNYNQPVPEEIKSKDKEIYEKIRKQLEEQQ